MEKCRLVNGVFDLCDEFRCSESNYDDLKAFRFCPFCGTKLGEPRAKYRAFKEGEMPVEFLDYYYQRFDEGNIYKVYIMDPEDDPVLRVDDTWWNADELFKQFQYKKSLSDPEWMRVGVKQIIGEKI